MRNSNWLLGALVGALGLVGCSSGDDAAGNTNTNQVVLPPVPGMTSGPTTPTSTTPTTPTTTTTTPTTNTMPTSPTTPIMPVDTTGMAGSGAIPMDTTEPMQPGAVATGISVTPIEYNDPNLQCFEFRAHQGSDLNSKLMVGVANDRYLDVVWDAPWTGTVYARSFETLVDNAEVIHHWLFYQGANDAGGRSLMVGWAPGGSDTFFSPDLGMEMPQQQYSIQYHYNSGDPSAVDASGVKICYTTTPPENIATISWLGTDAISGTSATGTCKH